MSWTPRGAEGPVWADVSFRIDAGETVILEGPSGSGKSTLLRCIVHLEAPTAGTVVWRDHEVTAHNIRQFRNRVVYIHQSPVSIAPTIEENLSFARQMGREHSDDPSSTVDAAGQRELLARFDLADLDFSRRFDELSVGEQQRVAFVRCMTVRPQILFLDEPTAALDPTNAGLVEDFVESYVDERPERAALWITHDREQRARLDGRIVDIEQWTSPS